MGQILSQVLWHSTPEEAAELVNALAHHCTCDVDSQGELRVACAPHQMLIHDQRALNGLLFARRIAERLRLEEFTPELSGPSQPRLAGSELQPSAPHFTRPEDHPDVDSERRTERMARRSV